MQIVPQILPRFKISSTRLLALQCSKKFSDPVTLDSVFTTSQKCIFNVHQVIVSKKLKIQHFLATAWTKILLSIHQNTHFQVRNSLFLGMGLAPPQIPSIASNQAFWIRPYVLPEFQLDLCN